jgi:hypothetical protein
VAWNGYVEYDSTEIINVERTEKYIGGKSTSWFKQNHNSDALEEVFGTTYSTPLADNAPWTDPDKTESYDFWGVHPISIEGIEDSTRESTVVEYIRNGGNPGRLRHATKSVVFSAALFGASECAVEYGFGWLKAALLGRACLPNATGRCYGADLTYFNCEPTLDQDLPPLPPDVDPVHAVLDGGYGADRTQLHFYSNFELADNDTTLGPLNVGDAEWEYEAGGFGVSGGNAKPTTGGTTWSSAVIETGQTNLYVESLIVDEASSNTGLKLRSDGAAAGIAVYRDRLWDTAFPATQIGAVFSQTFADGDRWRVQDTGTSIRVWRQVGGVGDWALISDQAVSQHGGNTKVGLSYYGNTTGLASRWADFSVAFEDNSAVIVDGGAPNTTFTASFDGGAPDTVFPVVLTEPYPEPFVAPEPEANPDPTGCITNLQRTLKNVQVNLGPSITAKRYLSDGSCMWTVQWTAVAGDPFEYGHERVVLDGFLGGETTDPFGPDVSGPYDEVGYAHADAGCPPQTWEPVYDPLCPALVAPPGPVDIPAGCFEPRDDWWRRYVSIPEAFVPLWGSSVPVVSLTAQYEDLRQVRLRFYSDPTASGDPEANECSPVGDLMVTYVPQGMTLVIDGVRQSVYIVDLDGVSRRADSLVFSSTGTPIEWPELICGYGYLMTIDTTAQTVWPEVDLSLVPKVS